MAKKNNNNNKKKKMAKPIQAAPEARNPVVLIAKMRNSAGPMKSRNQKRQNRKSWKKDIDCDII
jgi:hypothetical protein